MEPGRRERFNLHMFGKNRTKITDTFMLISRCLLDTRQVAGRTRDEKEAVNNLNIRWRHTMSSIQFENAPFLRLYVVACHVNYYYYVWFILIIIIIIIIIIIRLVMKEITMRSKFLIYTESHCSCL